MTTLSNILQALAITNPYKVDEIHQTGGGTGRESKLFRTSFSE